MEPAIWGLLMYLLGLGVGAMLFKKTSTTEKEASFEKEISLALFQLQRDNEKLRHRLNMTQGVVWEMFMQKKYHDIRISEFDLTDYQEATGKVMTMTPKGSKIVVEFTRGK